MDKKLLLYEVKLKAIFIHIRTDTICLIFAIICPFF
uniref:Uncharacterized protein n=1 Tax=Arundo donax TaxID=35708 RepID=A0A0A9FXI5_ARUDO